MSIENELEDKLKECADSLDDCASIIRNQNVEPVKENIHAIVQAIAEISDVLAHFKSFQEELKKPWKRMCSFCELNEDQVAVLIQGPGVLICNSCVESCVEVLKRDKNYVPTEEDISITLPKETSIGEIRALTSNHHFNTSVKLSIE